MLNPNLHQKSVLNKQLKKLTPTFKASIEVNVFRVYTLYEQYMNSFYNWAKMNTLNSKITQQKCRVCNKCNFATLQELTSISASIIVGKCIHSCTHLMSSSFIWSELHGLYVQICKVISSTFSQEWFILQIFLHFAKRLTINNLSRPSWIFSCDCWMCQVFKHV